jgi:hypothetical protein
MIFISAPIATGVIKKAKAQDMRQEHLKDIFSPVKLAEKN